MTLVEAREILNAYGYANQMPKGGEPQLRLAIRTLLASMPPAG